MYQESTRKYASKGESSIPIHPVAVAKVSKWLILRPCINLIRSGAPTEHDVSNSRYLNSIGLLACLVERRRGEDHLLSSKGVHDAKAFLR
jgi:hypothetical protein